MDSVMAEAIRSMGKKPKRPLGKFNPWAWGLEPVRGCNLKCWHCPARLLEPDKYEYMTREVWEATWRIIRTLTPYCRVEMAHTGEPTLHPDILEYIHIARQMSPRSQIQITTNGTTLMRGAITYKELFDAGINIVYVDMYAPKERHCDLAERSGYPYFRYYEADNTAPNAWSYHNDPAIQFIALSEIPDNWPKQKISRGGLGTFLNNIDFKRGSRLGITPVKMAPARRCSQPMKYVQVACNGDYMMCCQDALYESKVKGNTIDGKDGFLRFWFGEYMQWTRQRLREKDRAGHPICAKCNIMFSRCDMKFWDRAMMNYYWDGQGFKEMASII